MVTGRKSHRRGQPVMAVFLLIAVGILSFPLTRELNFLVSISIIFIGVQTVIAINFHLLAPRSTSGPGTKSHEPFRFRTSEQTIISAVFALAGIATLTGALHAGTLAGWLALAAAAVGAANVIATYRTMADFEKPPEAYP